MLLPLGRGQRISREEILRKLVEIQCERSDPTGRSTFRVRGDIVEVYPACETGLRIELFGDDVGALVSFDPLTGKTLKRHDKIAVYPKSHFVAPRDRTRKRSRRSKKSWPGAAGFSNRKGGCLAQRLHQRTMFRPR